MSNNEIDTNVNMVSALTHVAGDSLRTLSYFFSSVFITFSVLKCFSFFVITPRPNHDLKNEARPQRQMRIRDSASALYARNLLDFLKLILTQDGGVAIPADDDIVAATLVTRDGAVLRA